MRSKLFFLENGLSFFDSLSERIVVEGLYL